MEKDKSKITLVGGQLLVPPLTSALSEQNYACAKAFVWLDLLKDLKVPTKWLKPTKKGTRVDFDIARTQKQLDDSTADLKGYILSVNEKYDAQIEIVQNKPTQDEKNLDETPVPSAQHESDEV